MTGSRSVRRSRVSTAVPPSSRADGGTVRPPRAGRSGGARTRTVRGDPRRPGRRSRVDLPGVRAVPDEPRRWRRGSTDIAPSADPPSSRCSTSSPGRRSGVVSYLNVVPRDRRDRARAHLVRARRAARPAPTPRPPTCSCARRSTTLGNRRVEWKCDALNARSRAAAERLGFTFEGVFRQHMIVKGRNRDTAWFSMLDAEWPARRDATGAWLAAEPGSLSLRSSPPPSGHDGRQPRRRREVLRVVAGAAGCRPRGAPSGRGSGSSVPTAPASPRCSRSWRATRRRAPARWFAARAWSPPTSNRTPTATTAPPERTVLAARPDVAALDARAARGGDRAGPARMSWRTSRRWIGCSTRQQALLDRWVEAGGPGLVGRGATPSCVSLGFDEARPGAADPLAVAAVSASSWRSPPA